MNTGESFYDCTSVIPNNEHLILLNNFFQVNGLSQLNFEFTSCGPVHQPLFTATSRFMEYGFFASATSKKECEKKIKSLLWYKISQGEIKISPQSNQNLDSDEEALAKIIPFKNFASVLDTVDRNRSVLIIDLENLGEKNIQDPKFMQICRDFKLTVICVFARLMPVMPEFILIKRDDLHRDSADEGIRRIIFYLVDCLKISNVALITKDHFGQNLKDILDETGHNFSLFMNMTEFKIKYKTFLEKQKEFQIPSLLNHNSH